MKMIPIRAAKLSSVNLVKYLTNADQSKATMIRQKRQDLCFKYQINEGLLENSMAKFC